MKRGFGKRGKVERGFENGGRKEDLEKGKN